MKKIAALFLALVVFWGAFPAARANASPSSGCTFIGIEGRYITQIDQALDRINAIRKDACDNAIINPNTGVALTSDDYVPIQWSADLEEIARTRALEASVSMGHSRLNGESIWGLTSGGISSGGEVIAWNGGQTMLDGINQWYEEKSDWLAGDKDAAGHYLQMIDPNNRYIGLATFYSSSTAYHNTTVGEFSSSQSPLDTSHGSGTSNAVHTLEVLNQYISSTITVGDNGELSVTAAITYNSNTTEGLSFVGSSQSSIIWSSSDNSVVTVTNGKLTVKKCGAATITASLPDGSTATKSVTFEHDYKETSTTPATCGEDGEIVSTCEICGDVRTEPIPMTEEHKFGEWKITKAPTERADGEETRTCTVCGEKETRDVEYDPDNANNNAYLSGNSDKQRHIRAPNKQHRAPDRIVR